jgi:hypothetical protein
MDLKHIEGIVSYYFSVTDNDAINNYKTTTSDNFTFQFPNRDEILAKDKEQFDELQENIDKSRELAKEIKKDLNNLQLKKYGHKCVGMGEIANGERYHFQTK